MAGDFGRPGAPLQSVVVTVCDGARVIGRCLQALIASDLPRALWELIVVDDGSRDGSVSIAAGHADVVVRLPGPPHGPAYARNRGAEASLGPVIVFVDADVCVHADALRRIAWAFARRPELGAMFGSYDADSPQLGDISQYRNLRHHYAFRREAGAAETFWAALGAVRREAFLHAGQFDEWRFSRPQIEDVELGYRLRRLGYPIGLDPTVQGTHLKRWTLRGVVRRDLFDRSIPWIRLRLAHGSSGRPGQLLFRPSEWTDTALMGLAFLLLVLAALARLPALAALAGVVAGAVVISSVRLFWFFGRRRGLVFALRMVPVHLLYHLLSSLAAAWAWVLYQLLGAPTASATVRAQSEAGPRRWPPHPRRTEASFWMEGGAGRREG
ncbi:MAG TPA: glycosyltransferase family 2 protein [Gemmatimonadales bacterium]